MTDRPEGPRTTRNERRAAARERAQRLRTRQKRRQRGWRVGLQAGIVVALLAVVAVVTLVLVQSVRPAGPGPDNTTAGGITIGKGLQAVGGRGATPEATAASDGSVRISLYVDYLCPYCGAFEQANGAYIEGLVDSGAATVDIHPIAILSNRSQGTKYSLRAANAAACVADRSPDRFFAVNRALFAQQPEEGTPGLTDAELTKVVTGVAGVRDRSGIATCISEQTYGRWVDQQTSKVTEDGVPGSDVSSFPGTPLVLVDGKRYDYSTPFRNAEFRSFVVTTAGAVPTDGDGATPTPSPTASATPSGSSTPAAG